MKTNPLAFKDVKGLDACIKNYFTHIEGEYRLETVPVKTSAKTIADETTQQKVWIRPPEPPTLSGLAFFLGFESCSAIEACMAEGRFAGLLRRARLRIEAEYEKKLHYPSSTGAIFALKHMGWQKQTAPSNPVNTLSVIVNQTGPPPASREQEVEV